MCTKWVPNTKVTFDLCLPHPITSEDDQDACKECDKYFKKGLTKTAPCHSPTKV